MAQTLEDKLFDTLNEILSTLSNGEMAVSISSIDDPEGVDTIINNTTDNPIPVVIQNTDSTIDLDVRIAENITIDTSTPLDVSLSDLDSNNKLPVAIDSLPNVTIDTTTPLDVDIQNTNLNVTIQNGSLNTNATIQGTPNVNVTNSSFNVNSTIQNTNIVTRPELDAGSGIFNYLAGDSNGRQYVYSQTNWDTTALAFLQTSNTVDHWVNAYADGVLSKKYVETYNDEFEETVYLTHPKFTTGNALKLVYQYTTQNSLKVVESIYPSVVAWTYDDEIQGSVSVTVSNLVSPDPNFPINLHDVVADLTIVDNTLGDVTISLSGTSADYYHVHNVTTGDFASSLPYISGNTYQIHAGATDWSGSSYSHSLTVTVTGEVFGITDSETIETTGTYVSTSYSNEYAHQVNNTQSLYNSAGTLYTWGGNDYHINPATAVQNRTIKHAFEGMGYLRTGGNQDYNGYPYTNQSYTWSVWFMYPTLSGMNNFQNYLMVAKDSSSTVYNYINVHCLNSSGNIRLYGFVGYNSSGQIAVGNSGVNLTTTVNAGQWYNLTCVRDASANTHKIFLNGNLEYSDTFNSSATDSTNVEIDDLYNYGNFLTAAYHGAHITRPTYANTGLYFCIDELATFNTAIAETGTSSLSVEYIYNQGAPRDLTSESGLIGYWRFGDGDDGGSNNDNTTTIYDMSASGNHITSRDSNYTPTQLTLTSSDNIYVPPTSSFSNEYKLEGVPFYSINGVYSEANNGGFFSTGTTFENVTSTIRKTFNFWFYMPSSYSGEVCYMSDYFGTNSLGGGYAIISRPGVYDIGFATSSGSYYRQTGINLPSGFKDTWIMVTIIPEPVPANTKFYLQNSATFNSSTYTLSYSQGNWNYNPNSNNITLSSIFGVRVHNSGLYPTSSSGLSSNTFAIDDFTAWDKALSVTEIEELHNSFQVYDYTTHSANSNLYRYVRFGDVTGDSESSIKCQIDSSFVLDKNGSATGTYINSLTSSEAPYTPASGAWANQYYATKGSSANVYDPTYIKLTDSTIASFSSKAFSFSFWFKSNTDYTNINVSTGGNTSSHHIINTNTPSIGITGGYYIVIWGTDLRIGRAYDVNNAYRFLINGANNSMFDGNWHHIVITHDGTTNASDNISDFTANHDVYIDAVLQTKSSAANFGNVSTTNTYTDTDLYLGKWYSASSFSNSNSCGLPYLGKIDECSYWANRKLSTNNNGVNEISLIYNSGTPIDLENTTNIPVPTTYFRFEDNTDLGFESVTASNTTNELLLQQGAY